MDWLDNIFSSPQTPTPLLPVAPSLYDTNAMLSSHYALKDFIGTSQSLNQPNMPSSPDYYYNLSDLANFVELIESKIGPVQILSGYRTKELQNALTAAGEPTSAGTSFHELGRGIDIYPTTMPINQYFGRMLADEEVKNQMAEVAYKPGQNSIHIGINILSDVRPVKVLALNDANVYGRLSLDEIASFIAPYMESADEAMDYAAAQLVTFNRMPLIIGAVAAAGGVLYLALASGNRTGNVRANTRGLGPAFGGTQPVRKSHRTTS